jgi:YD repeat-containing protein
MNTARRATTGHPVIIATGEKSIDHTDFQLPGAIELVWRRQYRSGDARTHGWFGQGWSHALATELWIDDDVLRHWDEQGREVVLPAVKVGQEHFEAYEQFTLTRPAENHWALRHNQGQTHHFRQRHALQRQLPLEVIQDRNRRRIVLQFDDGDFSARFDPVALPPRPRRLIDSAGRKLSLNWTDRQQLADVAFESSTGRIVLATYAYGANDGQPDLVRHTDPNGHSRTYSWEQHLLVGYTLATGQRFSNRYDRLSPAGRVVESLALDDGTGQRFDYNGRTTRVQDRLGRETVYVSNARQDIVAVHDAAGNVTRTEFDDAGRPAGTTDPLGRSSITTFDARGNLTSMVDAAGNATTVEYNALNLPTKLTDAMGGEWLRQYDERGNLIASTDPLGHTTLYEVDALGQVTAIVDALDKRKKLEWDEAGNLSAYTDCSGYTTRYSLRRTRPPAQQ